MAYEIPQQLKYEEKIIFGLTVKQLGFASLFLFPALLIFLRSNLDFIAKIIITTILGSLGCLFMFFNFWAFLKDFAGWLNFREIWLMESKMIEFLGLEKVENGEIHVWKTRKRAVSRPLSREEKKRLLEKISTH